MGAQLAATRASPPPLPLSTGFIPVGATTGSYPPRRSALQFLRLGLCPKRNEGRGARCVAASHGSTGTRPAEAQHCASNARNTLLPLSTGFTPVGATTGSYPRIPHHPCRFPPGLSRLEQQLTATSRRSALQFIGLGLCPKRDEGRGARCVAASRGSTGTRPMEAQHCAPNARNTLLPLSTGLIPVGAQLAATRASPTAPAAFHRVYPGGSNNWQLRLAAPRSNSFAWGFAPSGMRGGGRDV